MTLTTRGTRYEYDSTEIYLVRAYNHSDMVFQDPFGDRNDMYFTSLESAQQFVREFRRGNGDWVKNAQGWFYPIDQWHGYIIVELQLVSEVRALKQVAS